MTTHREIRTNLANMLLGISGIGEVHEFERYSKRLEDLKSLYAITPPAGAAQQIRGWFIRRVATDYAGATTCPVRNDEWEVRGFMSLDDAGESELVFDDLVDSVIQLFFEHDPVLPGLRIGSYGDGIRARLTQSQPVLFGGVLCHSATINVLTRGFYVPVAS